MFWSKNKRNRFTPVNPSFTILKWVMRGYTFHGHVFVMLILVGSFRLFSDLLYFSKIIIFPSQISVSVVNSKLSKQPIPKDP